MLDEVPVLVVQRASHEDFCGPTPVGGVLQDALPLDELVGACPRTTVISTTAPDPGAARSGRRVGRTERDALARIAAGCPTTTVDYNMAP
ncbi:hypothetical protein ACFV3R_23320 [Streptomyces sp. NPDC059740]|uniref:hypothetical protein n=1 Tax=Streptomyces sp. NPDC059740 TaxID=3346926 RepID=UPI003647077F